MIVARRMFNNLPQLHNEKTRQVINVKFKYREFSLL